MKATQAPKKLEIRLWETSDSENDTTRKSQKLPFTLVFKKAKNGNHVLDYIDVADQDAEGDISKLQISAI